MQTPSKTVGAETRAELISPVLSARLVPEAAVASSFPLLKKQKVGLERMLWTEEEEEDDDGDYVPSEAEDDDDSISSVSSSSSLEEAEDEEEDARSMRVPNNMFEYIVFDYMRFMENVHLAVEVGAIHALAAVLARLGMSLNGHLTCVHALPVRVLGSLAPARLPSSLILSAQDKFPAAYPTGGGGQGMDAMMAAAEHELKALVSVLDCAMVICEYRRSNTICKEDIVHALHTRGLERIEFVSRMDVFLAIRAALGVNMPDDISRIVLEMAYGRTASAKEGEEEGLVVGWI